MGLLSILFGEGTKLKIAELDVDVSLSESHEMDVDLTQNPVEEGADVTDHVVQKPYKLTVEGYVSDTPIAYLSGLRNALGDSPSKTAFTTLKELHAKREPIEVSTGLEFYENMILKSLKFPRDAKTGNGVRFNATFEEIRVVSSSIVKIPKKLTKAGLGKIIPKGAAQKVSEDNASALAKFTGFRG